MPIKFILEDPQMPRTVFWQGVLDVLVEINLKQPASTDIYIPAEDLAMETNWPRYGQQRSSYIRGTHHSLDSGGVVSDYFARAVQWAANNPEKKMLLINMHPFFRVPLFVANFSNIHVGDVSLSLFDRCINRNCVSMPALPIDNGAGGLDGPRAINISFQGVASHPVREKLRRFDNRRDVIINIVSKSIHNTLKLDATTSKTDLNYSHILRNTNFALVPRGDALFSYRLLEVLSYGCVPVIISDGWVLPFDRQIDWPRIAYIVHESAVDDYLPILLSVQRDELLRRQKSVNQIWNKYFSSLSKIIQSLIYETHTLTHVPD